MKRVAIILTGLLFVAALFASTAYATSPHFIKASASGPDASGNLKVSFKEAGLGNNQLITYVASADATATYACQNNGGNFPQDPKKQQVSGPVTATGTFSSGKNGTISRSLTLTPPASTLNCPPGQHEVLGTVSYTNVRITDTTNNVFEDIPGIFSRTFVVIP